MKKRFALLLTICACSTDVSSTSPPKLAQRDSSGTTIIEIATDPWQAPVWATVDTVNVMRIRAIDSVPATMFEYLAQADRLANGNIVTVDWQGGDVNVWSPTGDFVGQVGRTGDGPGEFRNPLVAMAGPGDSIHVMNPGANIDVFTKDRVYVRRLRLGEHSPLRPLSDGSYLISRGDDVEVPLGKVPLYSTIFRLRPDGDTTWDLARYLDREETYVQHGRTRERVLQLFQPNRYAMGSSFGFVWCDPGTFTCDHWSEEGRKFRSLRVTSPARPATQALVEEYRKIRYGNAPTPERRRTVDADIAESERAATLPFYSIFRIDELGRHWFREYDMFESRMSPRWVVLSSTGEILGRVTLPSSQRILKIGADYILALESDSTGAQMLAMYRHAPVSR